MDYDMNFMAYFITRLPNPTFSPELQAKTTVVDFTVRDSASFSQHYPKLKFASMASTRCHAHVTPSTWSSESLRVA